ncbi:hypothetical protein ACFL1Z_03020 [Thermodesulfobacteriota bacterium]
METLDNLIIEERLCGLFDCTPKQLATLRTEQQLPYLKINRNKRIYLESDIMKWLLNRSKVSDKNELSSD